MIIPVKKRIQIFDTTLRDGEQAPGASLTPEQKIILAYKLAELGVDVLEPGFPVSSPGDFAAVETISRKVEGVEICGFARAVKGDIDAAVRATRTRSAGGFTCSSPLPTFTCAISCARADPRWLLPPAK